MGNYVMSDLSHSRKGTAMNKTKSTHLFASFNKDFLPYYGGGSRRRRRRRLHFLDSG